MAMFILKMVITALGLALSRKYLAHQHRKCLSRAAEGAQVSGVDIPGAAPLGAAALEPGFEPSVGSAPPRVVGGPRQPGDAAVEDHGGDPLRVGGREEHAHRAALGDAEQRDALGA